MHHRPPPPLPAPTALRVVIHSDVRLHADGLASTLRATPELQVVGVARTWPECGRLFSSCGPDAIVTDMPAHPGANGVRSFLCDHPTARVVAVGVPDAEDSILACAELGLSGYVLRDGTVTELVQVVSGAVREEFLCSPRIAARLARRVSRLTGRREAAVCLQRLTAREREVAALVAEGMTNKQIARCLSIAVSTVKNHVHSVLDKLGLARRGEAALRLRELERAAADGLRVTG